MVPFAGFDMPVVYTGISGEHNQVRNGVGLFDVSHMGEIRVRGPRAAETLSWLLSNAVRRLEVGRAQYNALCNATGGVVDDVYAYRVAEDDFLVCVNASNRAKDFAWFKENDRFDSSIEDEGDAWAQVAIQGPRAVDVVASLMTSDIRSIERPQFVAGTFAGLNGCFIARTGYTGEDGFEIFLPVSGCESVWEQVLEAGKPYGILPIGLGARDTLRLEAGNCLYGHELSDDTNPLAAGLGWIVKTGKPGGFLGADAILARKDPRRLVGLEIEGGRIAREQMAVLAGGENIGIVTSGTLGPFVGKAIALAYVDLAHAELGSRVDVDIRGRVTPAVVVPTTFYRRR